MRKFLSPVFKAMPVFLFGFLLIPAVCTSSESLEERAEDKKSVLVEAESSLQKIKENELIEVDKDKVPIRISEGIKTPEAVLESISNKTFSGNIISVNFKELDIRVAIKRFVALLGYPIKIDPNISGKVTYAFRNAPWNHVLSHFLHQNQFEILFDGLQLYVRKKKDDTPGISSYLFLLLIPLVLVSLWLVKKYLLQSQGKKSAPPLNIKPEKIQEYVKRIVFLLDVEKAYKEEDFSLKKLADLLSLQPYVVSRIINERLNRSYPGLLNHYRIEEAKRILTADNKKTNILDTAFEVGFKSKTAFNRIFKKLVGITPSEFRKKNQS